MPEKPLNFMILYRLRCSKGHEFESWFKDSKSYERQEKKFVIGCAVCGDSKVKRAIMSPRIGRKGNAEVEVPVEVSAPAPVPTPAQQQMAALARQMPKELREALIKVRTEVEKSCEHVGPKFAEEARKIHYGESDKRGIYGETSDKEAEALADEGIEFGRLPWIPRGGGACSSDRGPPGRSRRAGAPRSAIQRVRLQVFAAFRLSRLPPRISAAPAAVSRSIRSM